MNETQQLKQRITELENTVKKLMIFNEQLQNSSQIPLRVDQSFRSRFISNILQLSTKTPASESQTVDEGGVATYDVLTLPDGFKTYNDGGTPIFIPYYL